MVFFEHFLHTVDMEGKIDSGLFNVIVVDFGDLRDVRFRRVANQQGGSPCYKSISKIAVTAQTSVRYQFSVRFSLKNTVDRIPETSTETE